MLKRIKGPGKTELYKIVWRGKATGYKGSEEDGLTKEQAAKRVRFLNRKYKEIDHRMERMG